MLRKYADKRTERFANGERVPAFSGIYQQAHKRLFILRSAPNVQALREIRSNRLEVLRGDRQGQYSIRINDQWRICFTWADGDSEPFNIEIVEYH